jgi:hypothetical protein
MNTSSELTVWCAIDSVNGEFITGEEIYTYEEDTYELVPGAEWVECEVKIKERVER